MSSRTVFFNGKFVPESEARLSIFDSALMYGDMAFEMTRTFRQKPFCLREHLERLYSSLRLLEIDCGMSIKEMEQVTLETLERNLSTEADDMDWQIMHDVSRGPLPLYRTAFSEEIQPTVSINCWPLITHMGSFAPKYDTGVQLMIPAQQTLPAHLVDLKAKTRSRLHYRIAELQAERSGDGCLPLMFDTDGYLAEGSGWNVFLVKDGVVFTPEPRNILIGVSRSVTISLARELGIEVRETNLGRYEVLMADEILCTATTYSLVHASTIEGQTVGDGQPGVVFRKLLSAWRTHVGVDFVEQARNYASRLEDWLRNKS